MRVVILQVVVFGMLVAANPVVGAVQERINEVFAEFDASTPGCSVAAALDDEVVYTGSFGAANLEHGVENDEQTRFYAGSVSKQFTAAAVGMLALEDKISLDDSLQAYFPELPGYAGEITIRQLIHHTSGLRDYTTLFVLMGRDIHNAITQDEIIDLIAAQERTNFDPGAEYLYSNSGYFLLGVLVERVTGQSLREFADTNIFAPLGMTKTHFHDNHLELVPDRAEGHLRSEQGWLGNRTRVAQVGGGGLITTASDLLRWNARLHGTKSPLNDLLLSKGKLNSGEEIPYAFGVAYGKHRGLTTLSHGGALGGFRAHIAWYPNQRFSIAVLCNLDQISTKTKADRVAEIVLADHLTAPVLHRAEVQVESEHLNRLVGRYALSPTFEIEITREKNQLYAQATGQAKHPIYPETASKFFYKVVDAQITFGVGESDEIDQFVLHQNGADIPARRIGREFALKRPREEYVGDYYARELAASTRLYTQGEQLWSQVGYGEPTRLTPVGDDEFVANTAVVTFLRDTNDRVHGMQVTLPRVRKLVYEKQ